jgi:uncharacterized protein YndB with AHSA1/START domain
MASERRYYYLRRDDLPETKRDQRMANPTTITAEPGKMDILVIREFDAPRDLVFKAYTDPELVKQWLGPRRLKMIVEKFESRDGGTYRYIHEDDHGNKYAFRGVNHEVLPPERIIGTFEFEGLPERGHVALQTARFEALSGGRTRVTGQSVFQSVADRDGMLKSGMDRGVNEGFERLDDLLTSMSAKGPGATA